ncbi:MAG TPA: pilus assembly PilX N-terminal domain-containing protein [Pyrinomonadaceae bacterium]|nr:pilus assembly PilX N-terminal domain-containing protein [Pyrinomonadaceae bacterium]
MKKDFQKREKTPKSQEGIALITAIFSILLATVIGFALYYSSTIAFTIAVNDRDNTEAFYLADAGFNHALALMGKVPQPQFSSVLVAGANPLPDTGDELSVPPSSGLWTTSDSIPAGGATGGGVTNFGAGGVGRYWVSVKNDTATGETAKMDLNGILIVTSTGVGRDGSTATIEGTVGKSPDPPAILINSKTKIGGNLKVQGRNGSLHSNDTLTLSGNPCADQYFSSSADIVNSSNLKGTGCVGTGVNRPAQPFIQPTLYNIRNDFYGKTDYILGAIGSQAGKVYTGNGQLIADTSKTSNKWTIGNMTWEWNSRYMVWIQSGSSITNGSYYSEGNLAVTGNFGNKSIPARVTFIAQGCLYNKGKQYLSPAYRGISFVAGTDIKIAGKLDTGSDDLESEGLIYAHHQIDFAGTPAINGSVVAANQADTNSPGDFNLVPLDSGFMNIRGNPTIISNNTGGDNPVITFAWREVRQ